MHPNAQPKNMHIAGVGGGAVGEEGAPVGRPAKLKHPRFPLKAFHPPGPRRWAFRFEVCNELASRCTEPLAVRKTEPLLVAEKLRGDFKRWH
jgi:hypothetical protein